MATSDMTNPYEQIWKTRDLRALNTPVELDNRIPEWKRGLNAFGKEMQATGYGLLALGSQGVENAVGENPVTKGITNWGLEGYNKSINESQSGLNAPSVAKVEDIKNFSDATDWASYQLGKGLPMIGSLMLSGGVGGAVARVGANAGVKALAKSAVGSAVEKAVATKAVQAAEGQIVTQAMKAAAAQSLRDTFTKGAIAGGFAGSFGLEGGQAFGEQVSQGVAPADAVKTAAAVGGINGLLEFLPFYKVAKDIGLGSYAKRGIAEIIASDASLSKKALELAKEVGGRALKGGAEGTAVEGVTEGLQELVSIAGERWAKKDKLFADLTDNDWSRIKNSAITGAMVGGVAAGAGATMVGPETQSNKQGVLPTVKPTETSPAPTNQTKVQVLEAMQGKINAELEAAQASGDAAKVNELQQIKELYDKELGAPAQVSLKQEVSTQETLGQVPPAQETPIETPPLEAPPVIHTVSPTQEAVPPVRETPLDIPPAPPVTEQAPVVNPQVPPVTTAQGTAAGFSTLGTGMDATARIKARDDLLNGTPQIFKKPAAINTAKANPAYNIEDLADGSARVIGVLDPDTNTWVGKPPAVQQTPLAQQAPVTQQTPPVMQPPVSPRPGETVQEKQGEEIVLTPQGQSETKIVPTEEEKANLQQLLGERPTNTQQVPIIPPEVIPNAEEVQTQTEAPVNPNIPTAPLPDTGPGSDNTRFSMPQQQAQVISNPVNFDEEGIFEHVFTENETPTVVISGKYDSDKKELYIKRIDKNPKLNERKGLGIEALQNLIKTTELQGKPVDTITTEASEAFVKSLKRSVFADKFTVTDIPGIKEKDVVIDLTGRKTNTTTSQPLFSFAGQKAATANLMAKKTAEKRIELGDNPEVVRQETSWHQGADKKWRFEISDEDMKWKKSFDAIPESELFKDEKAVTLDEVIDHPKLFAAYPFLKDINLIKRKGLFDVEQRTQGWFDNDYMQIGVTPYAKNPLSTILHEIQHIIQMEEEFAKGGNESSVWEALPVETKENVAKGVLEKLKEKVTKSKDKLEIVTLLGDNTGLITDYNEVSTEASKLYKEFEKYEELPDKAPIRQQKLKAWREAENNLKKIEERISNLFDYKGTRLFNLPFELQETIKEFARLESSEGSNFKKEITRHKFKLNVEITDLLEKIAAIKSGNEKAIRAEANLYEFYKKLAGETEARLTQARQGMTKNERKQRSPQSMQEYPDKDQIVVMQGRQSLSAEQGPSIRQITPDELRANINSVMGNNWIQQAEAAGIIEVIDGAGPRGESGSWAGDKFRLYTQTMPANGSPLGVLLHEGSHAPTFNEILENSLEGYLKDLDTLADNGNQTARNAIAQATIAVADVLGIKHNLLQGGNKTDLKNVQALIEERKPGLLAEEKLAYFIQYAAEAKDGAGFLKRLINAIKAWFAQTQLGQALKQAGLGFELTEAMAVEWAKASLRNSLTEAQQAARVRKKVIAEAKEMPPSVRLGRAFEAYQDDIRYSLGLQEFKNTLWTDPTDSRQDFVNKPGLLQKFRANFIDFFAEIEKKSTQVYDAYSLLRNKKAARLVQARQEYMFPLRDLIAKSPWTSKEVGDMLAARHVKVDNVNTRLAERASYKYTKELLKSLSDAKRKELMKARSNVKSGMMPDGSAYIDVNGNLATMSARTKQKLMFDLMNKYVEFEQLNPDGKQELRFEWEIFKDAAAGFSNGGVGKGIVRSVDEVLAGTSKDQARFDKIANLFDAMNRHALQIREDGGLITPAEHARLLLDKTAYAPLRRESYNVDREIEQLFRYAGQGGSKQLGTRTGTAALSEPTLVLQNALAALEASAAAAERNLANQELYKVINADKETWKPWFSIVDADKYSTHDEDGFLQDRNATASNRADITLINKGKKLVIRPNMHNERAMGFVRAVNNLDSQVISGPMSVLNFFNNIVRWVNVTASPAFLMMNAIRDPGTALYNMQATEAAPYTKEIFANYAKSFKALKKVFLDGNRDPTDADVKMVEAFENAGGRTSFVEQLNPSDDTWRSFDAQVARRQGNLKQIMAAKDKWIDGLENFNVLFENVMRLSTFNVLVDKGTSKTRAARIAQDLTTNFTRRGYKTQALGNWWVFFNASVQGNYQVVRNLLSSKKLQALAGGTIVFALMLDLLGRAVADDWDEIPEWDKERFIILPIKVAGDFVKIPAPWVYNVLWRAGGMFGEMFSGVRKPQDMALDLAALTATTLNPLGKPGSIAQAVAPTAADPFVQILENKDFAGNPIGPEGFPGAGNKANSELLWNSTPKGYQSVARFVNELTGGSAVESGAVDLRPGDYQLLAKFLTGSLGRFLSDATFGLKENLEKGIEGPKEIPIVKEFFSEPYNPMRSQQYHTNIAATYGAYKLEKMYREGPERDLIKLHEVRQTRGKDLRMYNQAQDVERQIKSLRVRIRAAENRNDNARVEMLRGRVEEIQEKFNAAYKQRVG